MTGTDAVRQTALTCRGHTRPVTHLVFSDVTPDGYFLASACKDGRAMLRLGSTGDWIGTLEKHKGAVWCVSINPMATRAATASADHTVKLWDILHGHQLHQFDHKGIVKSVALSKQTTRLVTCGQDRNVFIYRVDEPSATPEEFEGPEVGSRHVIWGPTEREIYVASEDGSLTLTDLRTVAVGMPNSMLVDTAEQISQPKNWDMGGKGRSAGSHMWSTSFPDVIKDVHFTPDQRQLIVCHGLQVDILDIKAPDEPIRTYKLNCGILSADFHPREPYLVIGGDDHRLYKFVANESTEYEINRGHFGPIHAVRYSPDGELIASGSEDGTVRLWQHNVGQSYGLWRGIPSCATTTAAAASAAASALLECGTEETMDEETEVLEEVDILDEDNESPCSPTNPPNEVPVC